MSAVANGANDKPSLKELVYGPKNTPKAAKSSKPPMSPTTVQSGMYQSQNQPVKKKGWLPFRRKQSKATNGELRESNRSDSMTNLNVKVDSEQSANANAKAKADVKPNPKKYSGDTSGASLASQNAKWASLPELSNASDDYQPQPSSLLPAQREEDEPDLPVDAKNREVAYDTETLQDDSEEMGAIFRNESDADGDGEDADTEKRRRADSPTSIDTFNSILNSFESAIDAGKEAGYSDDRILDDAVDDTLIESHLSKLRTHNRQTSKASNSLNLAPIDEQQKNAAANVPSKAYEDAKLHSQVQVQVQVHVSTGPRSHRQTSSMTSSGSNTLSEGSTSDSLSVTNSNRLRNQQQIEQAHRFNANQKSPNSATASAATPVQPRQSQNPTTSSTVTKASKPEDSAPVIEKATGTAAAKLNSPPVGPAIETITVSSTVKPPVNGASKLPMSPTAPTPTHQRTSSHDQRLHGSPSAMLPSFPISTTSPAAANTTTRIGSGSGSAASVVHVRSTSGNVPTKVDEHLPNSAAISRSQRTSKSDSVTSLTTSTTAQVDTPYTTTTATADSAFAADKTGEATLPAAAPSDGDYKKIASEITPPKTPTTKNVPINSTPVENQKAVVKTIVVQKKVVAATTDAKSNRPATTDRGTSEVLRSVPSKAADTQESIVKKKTSTLNPQTRASSEQPQNAGPEQEQERGRSAQPRITTYSKWRQVGPGTNINPHSFIALAGASANANLNFTTPVRRDADRQPIDAFADRGRRSQSVGGAKARELENDLSRRERSRSPEIRHRLPLANSAAQYAEQRKQAEAKRYTEGDRSAGNENDHVDGGEQIGFRTQVELKLSNADQQAKAASNTGTTLQSGARLPSARPLVNQNSVTSAQKSNELQRSTTTIKQQILPVSQRQQPNRSTSTTNGPQAQQTVTTTTYVPLANASQAQPPIAKLSNATTKVQSVTQPSATDKQVALRVKIGTPSAATQKSPSIQTQRTSAPSFNKTPTSPVAPVQSSAVAKAETPVTTEQFSSSLELASAAFGVRLAPAERRVVPKRRVTTEINDPTTPDYSARDFLDTSAPLLAFDRSEPGQLV